MTEPTRGDVVWLTQAKYDELQAELEQLRGPGRAEVEDALGLIDRRSIVRATDAVVGLEPLTVAWTLEGDHGLGFETPVAFTADGLGLLDTSQPEHFLIQSGD